jgi:uridine phosphorylase
MNELDALVNIDFSTRQVKDELSSLNIYRLGTSGSVDEEVDIDNIIITEVAIGMEGLMHYYDLPNSIWETVYIEAFSSYIKPHIQDVHPYIVNSSEVLLSKFEKLYRKGTTVTAGGFYGPQGRTLRVKPEFSDIVEVLNKFRHKHFRITNLEMETAGIYGFGKLLGHNCLSVNAILANRIHNTFSDNPKKVIDKMIQESLELITS